MTKIIIIKYGELTTKKGNRNAFINKLKENIKNKLKDIPFKIINDRSRMYIETEFVDEVVEKLKQVFGIHAIAVAYKVDTDVEVIKDKVLELISDKEFKTFKVDTKRADKSFTIPSMEFNNVIGSLVLKNKSCKVDVHNPELLIKIEIRKEGTFIYFNDIKCLGGYPTGIEGVGLLMLSGGIDSPVSGYLTLKRGVDLECLYFESPPHTSEMAKDKVIKLASKINEYSGKIKVNIVPFTNIQEAILKNCDEAYIITIMRRMMYRIAKRVCEEKNINVVINGESIGQVASQTLTSMNVINKVCDIPVIRPLACLDKLEIIDIAKKIDTYDTSILPYEDCCTVFVPKHPVINPTIEKCILNESRFDYETLIKDAIANIEVVTDLSEKFDIL